MKSLIRWLFGLTAAFWTVVGALLWADVVSIGELSNTVRIATAVLMLGDGTVMGLLGWQVLRGKRVVDYFAVFVVVMNVLLTFTDEVGLYDLIYLVTMVVLLASLVRAMRAGRTPTVES